MLSIQLKLHLKSTYYISHLNPLTTFTLCMWVFFLLLPYTQLSSLSALFPWSMFFFKLEPLFILYSCFIQVLSRHWTMTGYFFNMVSIILKPWFHSSTWLILLYVTCSYIILKVDSVNYYLHSSYWSKFFFRLVPFIIAVMRSTKLKLKSSLSNIVTPESYWISL